jgi:hypothetical protein
LHGWENELQRREKKLHDRERQLHGWEKILQGFDAIDLLLCGRVEGVFRPERFLYIRKEFISL